jgi:hypothetical protein
MPEAGAARLGECARAGRALRGQPPGHLEASGYLERGPDPRDRRAARVRLTERGEAIRPAAIAAGRAVEEAWAAHAGAEEVEALRHALRRLLAAVGSSHPGAPDA